MPKQKANALKSQVDNTDVGIWVVGQGNIVRKCLRQEKLLPSYPVSAMRNGEPLLSNLDFSREIGNWDFCMNSPNFQLLIKSFKNSINQKKCICGPSFFITSGNLFIIDKAVLHRRCYY